MPYATYVAREHLSQGHVASVSYTIHFQLTRFDERIETRRQRPRALAGNAETLYFGSVRRFSVGLLPVQAIELPILEEFLYSTADGQPFTFDPYGTPDAPGMPLTVDREDEGHTKDRLTTTDDPLNADVFELSFEICERT